MFIDIAAPLQRAAAPAGGSVMKPTL